MSIGIEVRQYWKELNSLDVPFGSLLADGSG